MRWGESLSSLCHPGSLTTCVMGLLARQGAWGQQEAFVDILHLQKIIKKRRMNTQEHTTRLQPPEYLTTSASDVLNLF